jgi:hypothetical protein
MSKGGSAPKAPDPYATAAAQGAANRETAITQAGLNMVNQVTPNGSLTYSENGKWSDGTPRFTATSALSPTGQQLQGLNDQTQVQLATASRDQSQRLGSLLGTPVNFNSATPMRTSFGANDFSADRQRVEQALFDRLQPQMDRRRDQLETQLRNQGFSRGSAGWDQGMDDYNRETNDLRLATVAQGGSEQSRLAGLDQAQAGFQNNARTQQIAEILQQRNQPINETTALMSGAQVSGPNLVSTPQTGVGGVDVQGQINSNYQNQLNAYNQNRQGAMGGLFGIGGSIAGALPWGSMFSERALKEGIRLLTRPGCATGSAFMPIAISAAFKSASASWWTMWRLSYRKPSSARAGVRRSITRRFVNGSKHAFDPVFLGCQRRENVAG